MLHFERVHILRAFQRHVFPHVGNLYTETTNHMWTRVSHMWKWDFTCGNCENLEFICEEAHFRVWFPHVKILCYSIFYTIIPLSHVERICSHLKKANCMWKCGTHICSHDSAAMLCVHTLKIASTLWKEENHGWMSVARMWKSKFHMRTIEFREANHFCKMPEMLLFWR